MFAIDIYSQNLQNALQNKEPFSTYNKDLLHAAEIVISGFSYAEKEIYLLSNRLAPELYGDPRLHTALRNFLSKDNAELRILVEQTLTSDHPIIEVIRSFESKIKLGQISQESVETYDFNFMLLDNFGYRFEYDRNGYSAIASFYEDDQKEICEMLKGFFLSLEQDSTPVDSLEFLHKPSAD